MEAILIDTASWQLGDMYTNFLAIKKCVPNILKYTFMNLERPLLKSHSEEILNGICKNIAALFRATNVQ